MCPPGLSADELAALRANQPSLFPAQQPNKDSESVQLVGVPPDATDGSSSSESEEEAEVEDGPLPSELKTRADRGVKVLIMLEDALKTPPPRPQPNQPLQPALPQSASSSRGSGRVAPLQISPQRPSNDYSKEFSLLRNRRIQGTVEIPATFGGQLVGKGGEHIKQIQREHDVHINLPPKLPAKSLECTIMVSIMGAEEKVDACIVALQRMYHREIISFGSLEEFNRDVGWSGLMDLRKERGLRAEYYANTGKLVILGSLSDAQRAAQKVQAERQIEHRVEIPAWFIRNFQEQQGSLQRRLNIMPGIKAVSSDEDGILLTGKAGFVRVWSVSVRFYWFVCVCLFVGVPICLRVCHMVLGQLCF